MIDKALLERINNYPEEDIKAVKEAVIKLFPADSEITPDFDEWKQGLFKTIESKITLLEPLKTKIYDAIIEESNLFPGNFKRMVKFAHWLLIRINYIGPEDLQDILDSEKSFLKIRDQFGKEIPDILESILKEARKITGDDNLQAVNLISGFAVGNASVFSDVDLNFIWWNVNDYSDIGDWDNMQTKLNSLVKDKFAEVAKRLGFKSKNRLIEFPRMVDSFPLNISLTDYEAIKYQRQKPILVGTQNIVSFLMKAMPDKYDATNSQIIMSE